MNQMPSVIERYKERIKASGYTGKQITRSRIIVGVLVLVATLLFSVFSILLARQLCFEIQDERMEEYLEHLKERLVMNYSGNIEKAMDTVGAIITYAVVDDNDNIIYYCSESGHSSVVMPLTDRGVSNDIFSKQRYHIISDGMDFDLYHTDVIAQNGEHFRIVVCADEAGFFDAAYCTGSIAAFFCMAVFVVCYALFLRSKDIREGGQQKETASETIGRLSWRITTFILVGSVIAVLVSYFISDLTSTSLMKGYNDEYYERVMVQSLNEHYTRNELTRNKEYTRVKRIASELVALLDENSIDGEKVVYRTVEDGVTVTIPNSSGEPTFCMRRSGYLQEMAENAGLSAIRIFDSNGYQIATSDEYWKWDLDSDQWEKNYLFRQVLDRVLDSGYAEFDDDGDTYLYTAVPFTFQNGDYGLFVVEEPVDDIYMDSYAQMEGLMEEFEMDFGARYAIVRADENKTIEYVSSQLDADTLEGLNLVDDAFGGKFVDISYVNETRYFIQCNKRTDVKYFKGEPCYIATYFSKALVNELSGSIFFIACWAVQVILLFVLSIVTYNLSGNTVLAFDYRNETWMDETRGAISLTPEQKLVKVMGATITSLIAGFVIYVIIKLEFAPGSLYYHLMNYYWNSGFNTLTIVSIVTVGFLVVSLVRALQKLGRKIKSVVTPKTLTMWRIVISVLTYTLFIAFAFYVLYMLGMDIKQVWTSLGVFTLLIGLGAQSLIKDILAGFFIMIEDKFKIGDRVEVGNFSGTVTEVGLRSCTIVNSAGNVKIVNNSALDNVTNLSQQLTRYNCVIPIKIDFPYDRLCGIIEEELPSILEANQPDLKDIKLLGVMNVCASVGHPYYEIGINIQCEENQRSVLELKIKNALFLLGEEKGFLVG